MAGVARGWGQLADGVLAELGVSSSAAWCLIHLRRLGQHVRQGDLAGAMDISPPSLVRTLDQMQGAGLIVRRTRPDDRRSNRIALTPAGEELVGRIEAKLDSLRAELLDEIPEAAIEIVVGVLHMLGRRIAERRSAP